jgi:phytoene desaturase
VATGLTSNESHRSRYLEMCLDRIQSHTGENIAPYIEFKRSFAHEEFVTDYHSFRGNAYGLANTLGQTAVLKPRMKNRNIENLFYAGQLTVPGPGVPPAIISGQIAAELVHDHLFKKK